MPSIDLVERGRATGRAVYPGISALYAALTLLYLVAPPLEPARPYLVGLVTLALLTAGASIAVSRLPPHLVHALALGVSAAATLQAMSFVAYSGDPAQMVVPIICVLALSCMLLRLAQTAFIAALMFGGCWWLSTGHPPDVRAHWMINLGSTAVLAIVITRQRVRLLRALEHQAEDALAARDAALAADRTKSEFLATISHEIRTPLNAIVGSADLLAEFALPLDSKAHADTIATASLALLGLVTDVLDFSRVEAGAVELERTPLDPLELVERTCSLLRPRATSRGITLAIEALGPLPGRVLGDPVRLTQVLSNLVDNAIKFTEEGGVVVTLEATPEGIAFEVRDTGIGVPPEAQSHIFEAFRQADGSTTRRYGGTGLGLAICERLVAAMGGEIRVESAAGRGSTFSFRLPLPVAEIPRDPSAPPASGDARLLLVEDNPVNQRVAMRALERLGYAVEVADDGVAALEALLRQRFDAVLMDCQMPGMDGYEATAAVRARESGDEHLPIIALTANALPGDRQRCLDAGMDDFIAKPVRVRDLQRVLNRWVSM